MKRRTYAEVRAMLTPADLAAIADSVRNAPPLPPDAIAHLRRVFAGAGERMAAAMEEAA